MKKFTLFIILTVMLAFNGFSQESRTSGGAQLFNAGRSHSAVNSSWHSKASARNSINVQSLIYVDDFNSANDTDALKARGYLPYYRGSSAQGTTATWYQGAGAVNGTFAAYNGADTDYVAANYNVVTGA